MTPEEHMRVAAELLEAERKREQISILSLRYVDMDMSDAYAIQNEILRAKLSEGREIIGWKIGLTSKAMQSALGIDVPDSGILFDDMVFGDGSVVPRGRFIEPRIETEIAFVMGDSLGGGDVKRGDVLSATAYVVAAIEILDTRIERVDKETGRVRNVLDTISDNAANAGIVLGKEKHEVDAFDLRWVGGITERNGEVEETGLGAGVLNDPVESVVWLARRMAEYGQHIEAGQVVLSGSFIRPVECPSGSVIGADFGAFGRVDISFE